MKIAVTIRRLAVHESADCHVITSEIAGCLAQVLEKWQPHAEQRTDG
jgi:hypothetical protein